MKKISTLMTLLCLLISQGIFAQAKLQDPLPKDPNTVIGKLPNGITYYLRHNEEPKGQASFYIRHTSWNTWLSKERKTFRGKALFPRWNATAWLSDGM